MQFGSWRAILVAVLFAGAVAAVPNFAGDADPAPAGPAGAYVPLAAHRILDSRHGSDGGFNGLPLAAHHSASIGLSGRAELPPDAQDGGTVLLNVTVTDANSSGYLTVWDSGAHRPATSNVNFAAHRSTAGLVALTYHGFNSGATFYNGSSSSVQVVADVEGYFVGGASSAPGRLTSTAPTRLYDSRVHTALGGGHVVSVPVDGQGEIPTTGVTAVLADVVGVSPRAPGYLTAYADGARTPATSTVNFAPRTTTSNLAVVPVGTDGRIAVRNGSVDSAGVVVDVFGYFLGGTPTAAGVTSVVAPARLLDTRHGIGAARSAVSGGHTVRLRVADRSGVPDAGAATVTLNVTATGATRSGYVTVRPDGVAGSGVSTLNVVPGATVANLVVVPVAADGYVDLDVTSSGSVHLIADVAAWSRPATTITGRVVDQHGKPVQTSVSIRNAGSTLLLTTLTGSDGRFQFAGFDGTPMTLCYDGTQWGGPPVAGTVAAQCWKGAAPGQPTTTIDVALGTTFVADATLPPAGAISGTVRDAAGHPVASSETFRTGAWQTSEIGGEPGSYYLGGLPAGTYTVCFSAAATKAVPYGYVRQCWDDVTDPGVPTPITVSAGHVTAGVNAVLAAAGAASGTVDAPSATGTRQVVADVHLTDQDGSGRHYSSDYADATFSVVGIEAGTYSVCATTVDPFAVPSCANGTPSATVSVQAGELASGVAVHLAGAGGIVGVVHNGAGAVTGATVTATSDAGTVTGTTSGTGTYRLAQLPAGRYTVCFSDAVDGSRCFDNGSGTGEAAPVDVTVGAYTQQINATFP